MDIEDAHKLKILSTDETKTLLLNFFSDEKKKRRLETLLLVDDVNEQIAYLRSSVIGLLIDQCSEAFIKNEEAILSGTFNSTLIKQVPEISVKAYGLCSNTAVRKIYSSPEVLDVELSGYKIILTLLEHLITAVLNPEKSYSEQLLKRIPDQYETNHPTTYGKVLAVLDYISGMTDVYALDLYRKITGMSIPGI